jgi:hypothetical protein
MNPDRCEHIWKEKMVGFCNHDGPTYEKLCINCKIYFTIYQYNNESAVKLFDQQFKVISAIQGIDYLKNPFVLFDVSSFLHESDPLEAIRENIRKHQKYDAPIPSDTP